MNYAIYIAAAVVILLLIGLVVLAISILQRTVLRNIRSKTMGLLSLYDELLEEKSKAISQQDAQTQAVDSHSNSPSGEDSSEAVKVLSAAILNSAQRAGNTAYREEAVGGLYQEIRRNFSYEIDSVLPVLQTVVPPEEGPATQLLKQLDYDTIYQLSTLPSEDQYRILGSVLEGGQKDLLGAFCQEHKGFDALDFYDYLRCAAAAEPSAPRLLVTDEMAHRWKDKGDIEIVADTGICEGYQVEKNNKIYDYSIKIRELS